MQSGNAAPAHTQTLTFAWATGVTLQAAIETALAAFTGAPSWSAFFSPQTLTLNAPWLKMPTFTVVTTAANGVLKNPDAAVGYAMTQDVPIVLHLENTSKLTYTGSASASVLLEC